jgi:UDP-N-acetylmuramoylalanine--D-glutamate ligase
MEFKNKRFFVFGLGKSGLATCRRLVEIGAKVYAWDDAGQPEISNVDLINYREINWQEIDYLVLSPGIPFLENPHKIVELARGSCKIIGDVEILYALNPQAKFIAITGTNGKSTTTALIHHILISAGLRVEMGGNIGVPVLELPDLDADGIYVLELSSYQLDLLERAEFDISILLNITPDHLDRYSNFTAYCASKERIFKRYTKSGIDIIGLDTAASNEVFEKSQSDTIIPFSTKHKLANGLSLMNGVLHDTYEGQDLAVSNGEYGNDENLLAAYAACLSLGMEAEAILHFAKSFKALEHRMQIIGEYKNIIFYNDSKATNAQSTANALAQLDNIFWIAGGRAKEGGINDLVEYFPKVKQAFLIGEAEEEFAQCLDKYNVQYVRCGDLKNATEKAFALAQSELGQVNILLSPACASFDLFPNFEKRGEEFIKIVSALA